MKLCSKCNVDKNVEDFPIRKDRKSGTRNTCIDCFNSMRRERNKKNIKKIREQGKKHYENNRIKKIEWQKKYQKNLPLNKIQERKIRVREWYLKNRNSQIEKRKNQKERINLWQQEYYKKRDRKKLNANKMVSDALRNGTLVRPSKCNICGTEEYKIQGHHEDYNKPLEVIWVCTFCHSAIHKSLKEKG